ncbi:MAG: hypothetical protein LBI84_04315 [Propionibacteriaceae bacterium]|jgi:hypothetical protein|nr:hypothetical protein [Propionibacteriaceae bacterium]
MKTSEFRHLVEPFAAGSDYVVYGLRKAKLNQSWWHKMVVALSPSRGVIDSEGGIWFLVACDSHSLCAVTMPFTWKRLGSVDF